MRLWVVAYDIADDCRRNRLALHLATRMQRVQESVFEAWLHSVELRELLDEARVIMDSNQDMLRAYPLAMRTPDRCTVMGLQQKTQPTPNFWIL